MAIPTLLDNFITALITNLVGHTLVPSVMLVTLNILIFRQLKNLESSEVFVGQAGDELRDSIFKAEMSMAVSGTLVFSQTVTWVYYISVVSFIKI